MAWGGRALGGNGVMKYSVQGGISEHTRKDTGGLLSPLVLFSLCGDTRPSSANKEQDPPHNTTM